MLELSHSLIGASLAKLIPNPYLGLPISLLSHFLADLVPHWDLRTRQLNRSKAQIIFLSLTDASIGFLISYLLFYSTVPLWYLTIMIFTAQLPDWLEAPWHIFDWHFPPFSIIKKIQHFFHWKLDLPWGLIIQLAVAAGFACLALAT